MNPHIETVIRQATIDLKKQNAFGYEGGCGCVYQTDSGNSCAIGLVLKRHAPTLDLRNLEGSVGGFMNFANTNTEVAAAACLRSFAPGMDAADITLVFGAFQDMHDRTASDAADTYGHKAVKDWMLKTTNGTLNGEEGGFDTTYHKEVATIVKEVFENDNL